MRQSWGFRFQLATASALLFLFAPALRAQTAVSQTNCVPNPLAPTTCATAPPTSCDQAALDIKQGYEDVNSACGLIAGSKTETKDLKDCVTTAVGCKQQERKLGRITLDSGDTDQDDCTALFANGCPDLNEDATDLRKDKKDAQEARHELQKERDDLAQKANDAAAQAQQSQTAAQQQQQKDDQEYMQKSMDLSNKLQQTMSDMDDQRAKGVKEAQQSYDKLNVEYINMRSKLRQLNSTVTNTTLQWNVQCRTAATAAGKQAEDDMDKRMAAEDAQLINYQLRSAAGMTRRRLLKKRQKILDAYNTELTRCLEGQDGPGSDLKIKLNQAKNDLANTTAESNDRAARLETLRQNILSDMSSLETSLNQKTQMAVQQTSQQMQMLQQTHMMNQNMAQVQQQQSSQQAMQAQQLNAQQSKDIDDQLKDARDDEAAASTRLKCAGQSSLPKDTISSIRADRASLPKGQAELKAGCAQFQAFKCGSSDGHQYPLCAQNLGGSDTAEPGGGTSSTAASRDPGTPQMVRADGSLPTFKVRGSSAAATPAVPQADPNASGDPASGPLTKARTNSQGVPQ